MALSFEGFPDAESFADIERAVGAEVTTEFGPRDPTPAAETPTVEPDQPSPDEPPEPPEPPTGPFGIPIPSFIQPFVPDLSDIEELIEAFQKGIRFALVVVVSNVDRIIDAAIDKILNPIDTLKGALDVVTRTFSSGIATAIDFVKTQASRVITTISDKVGDAFQGVIGVIEGIINKIIGTTSSVLGVIQETISSTISAIVSTVGGALNSVIDITQNIITLIGEKITAAIEVSAAAIEAAIGVPFAKLADLLPFQISELGEILGDSLSTIKDLPEALGEKIKGIFSDLASTLGLDNLVHFTQILQSVFSLGDYHNQIRGELPTLLNPSGGIHSGSDTGFIASSAIPFLGSSILLSNPGIVERIRQDSMEHERPTIFSVPDGLELLRRFPEESESVIADLKRQGWADERIDQLTRLRFQLTPVADTLDAWRRNFIDDSELAGKLDSLGWSESDQALLRKLTFRIPPIQDMILFAIRGVFDVEESRAFGEFEGLPSALEAEFIRQFDIEGGDFSRQVEVFATEAQKLGLSPEWVAAYWTSHWRLPSLQTAYEMFHRLQPDILEAESDRVQADGFTTAELEFTRPELDRLVRAQDFSSFWRPKLAAIAFNPLTRVDIRRMHKLGLLERDAVVRAYRKVGFSPSDAELMTLFTEAFNAEPDQDQAIEVRNLTKTVILDFVETSILTPAEGVERLKLIGYDEFAAEALVDLELAKVERGLQRDQIDLIEEQVKLQILDLNAASIELDAIGVPAAQKQVIIRKLGVQLAPRPASPSKSDLDNFLNQRVIEVPDYRVGLTERGFSDASIDLYVKLDRRLPTRKELDTFFIDGAIALTAYQDGLRDLGYSSGIIELFSSSVQQDKLDAEEEEE